MQLGGSLGLLSELFVRELERKAGRDHQLICRKGILQSTVANRKAQYCNWGKQRLTLTQEQQMKPTECTIWQQTRANIAFELVLRLRSQWNALFTFVKSNYFRKL